MSSVAKAKRPMSAGRAKKVAKNSLVHIILGILAVVWLFPIFWIIMTSFRAESGAYTKYFFPHSLTFSNYTSHGARNAVSTVYTTIGLLSGRITL